MYYGIVLVHVGMHTVRYVHTCTLYSHFSETLTNALTMFKQQQKNEEEKMGKKELIN